MKLIALASLVFALSASTADARRIPMPVEPEVSVVKLSPSVLLEIQHKSDLQKRAISVARIYADGTWTFKPAGRRMQTGRITQRALWGLRKQLKSAPWTITHPDIACLAYAPEFTTYAMNGKPLFTSRMCGGEQIDDATRTALSDIEALLPKTK